MPSWLSADQYAVIEAAVDRLIPPDDHGAPGARAAGAADYIDGLLGAFLVDPPRIWAGGPYSGRHGGDAGFDTFLTLGAVEELAWRTRIEGSQGRPEREFNGPVIGLQERYAEGLARLGDDFADVDGNEQDRRLAADPRFQRVLYEHACEGTYGDPAYGGTRERAGWTSVAFLGAGQPRGWTDDEVITGG
ncbi:MAG: gluconate 2-dehydrogenase subunit 3 family protein [Acidimicrobiales bacterium]